MITGNTERQGTRWPPRSATAPVMTIVLAACFFGSACEDARTGPRLIEPTVPGRALSHEDSLRRGDFSPRLQASLSATACDIDCPQFLGADPGLYQGYGQPAPITLTFSGPVGFVRIDGRGAIQCSSGQYGSLIGYDSAGIELGRVDLHLTEPSDCSPPEAPDDVTYGATADLITTRPVARAIITPMSPLEFLVYNEFQGYAQANYGVLVGRGNLGKINLTCSDTVGRGDVTSCTAAPADPTQTLAVTGWSFTTLDGYRVDRQIGQDSKTWQGRLVVDGDVTVTGTVGGVGSGPTSARVAVRARNWAGRVTLKDHAIVSPSTMPARPTAFDGQFGVTALALPVNGATMSQWSVTILDEGPNNGFFYLTDLPVTVETRPQVNTNALNGTSDFYRIQEARQKTIGGITYCAQSYVLGIIPTIQAHEGYDPPSQPLSHAGIYRRHVDSVAYRVFEAVAGPSDQSLFSSTVDAVHTEAAADSRLMDHDSRNNIHMLCTFRYDYSRLK